MSRHGAFTLVSKNYFAFAQVLAESYLRHHPGHDFLIVLVDKADGLLPQRLACGAEVVEIAAFRVPGLARMIYRYTIMELNTAVKPFVMDDLLERFGFETLLYIDPDIWVLAPLVEVQAALGRASVVLTPHMRRPVFDDRMPSDTAILQSGTYNLGFIGLRRGDTSRRLLDWWKTKLHQDCVVDIPRGLFVDQKWIDLVPGFFPDTELLHHPGYNAAYWNLHERSVTRSGAGWQVDGGPLVFFHFSGYLPYAPETLSKHQNRHLLAALPALKSLTDAYAKALLDRDYARSCRWPYAFGTLPNGTRLPLNLVASTVQWAERQDIAVPCPLTEPGLFCSFLMSRGRVPGRPDAVLLIDTLLRLRPDVVAAFPGCVEQHDHPGLRAWLRTSGIREYQLEDLLAFEAAVPRPVPLATLLAHSARPAAAEPARVSAAWPGVHRILNLYWLRTDLQAAFPDLHGAAGRQALLRWLRHHRHEHRLGDDDIDLFEAWSDSAPHWLAQASFLYQHDGRARSLQPGLPTLEARRQALASPLASADLAGWLNADPVLAPPEPATGGAGRRLVNLAGDLDAPTGIGESGRSMAAAAAGQPDWQVRLMQLPHAQARRSGAPGSPALFGWPAAGADLSITVANADRSDWLNSFLPPDFWGRRRVGYWVWETESLPSLYAPAQQLFDEIWTPSRYAAEAIRATVDRPVRVLPHALDLAAIDRAKADRRAFGLPDDALVLGFAFDPRSVLERKNLAGLIDAFEAAFRDDDRCWLVLKVNDAGHASYDFQAALARVRSARVLVIDQEMDRSTTFGFIKSLDAYVSLHRSEGFGLTCAEAMACGLPVVASGYSGNLEFMDDDNSLLVPTAVVETDRPHGPYPAGTRWGQPDPQAAQSALRQLLDAQLRRQLGAAGRASVWQALSPAAVSRQLQRLVDEVPVPATVRQTTP